MATFLKLTLQTEATQGCFYYYCSQKRYPEVFYRLTTTDVILKFCLNSNPITCLSLEPIVLGFGNTRSRIDEKGFIWLVLQNGHCSYSNNNNYHLLNVSQVTGNLYSFLMY